MKRLSVTVTTASDGTVTAYTPRFSGKIHQIDYVKDGGANPYTDGVDFTITTEKTAQTLWVESNVNSSTSRQPRAPTHSTAGVAALYAAGGTGVLDKIGVANDRVKIVLAQGGATKVGAFHVIVDD